MHRLALILAVATLASCGGTSEPTATPTEPAGTATPGDLDVTLRFAAKVGDAAFACGQSYEGIGDSGSTFTPQDLRLYVYDLTLWTDAGEPVPLALTDDGQFQASGLALLDFEDATSPCTGTAETHTELGGTAPAGTYTALSFTVGVPFELNHQDPTLAGAPLNVTAMFWSWAAGYKFMRLDGASTGMPGGLFFHLGSAGCEVDDDGAVTGCDHPNRAPITLDGFDPATSTVVLDVGALYQDVDLDSNQPGSAPGCMSEPDDEDCAPSFAHLGISFASAQGDPDAQTVFRLE